MTLQQITIEISDKVLLVEKTDAESFERKIRAARFKPASRKGHL